MTPEERTPPEPEEHVEDLDVSDSDAKDVKGGGRKAGGEQHEYLEVKLSDVLIS